MDKGLTVVILLTRVGQEAPLTKAVAIWTPLSSCAGSIMLWINVSGLYVDSALSSPAVVMPIPVPPAPAAGLDKEVVFAKKIRQDW